MNRSIRIFATLVAGFLSLLIPTHCAANQAPTANPATPAISVKTADVDGLRIHYMTAGHGTALILLHGYAETSRMWRPMIPQLAGKFMVIAPDLPGIGDSSIPPGGMDMKKQRFLHSRPCSFAWHTESGSGRA